MKQENTNDAQTNILNCVDAYMASRKPQINNNPNVGLTRETETFHKTDICGSWKADESKLISVKSNLRPKLDSDGCEYFIVAIFERNPVHDGGELYIAGNETRKVPLTEKVVEALMDGRLIEAR